MDWWKTYLDDQRFGNYRIEEKLGQGGMAEVFRAVAVAGDLMGRTVAIKVPRLDAIAPINLDQFLLLFQREIKLQNAGSTPAHVASMLGAGKVTDRSGITRPYLVMDFYSGGSLAVRLGGRPGRRAHRQSLEEVLEWLMPIARALDHLHGPKGARLHRDVKPENILFDEADAPFLSDFGIATALNELGSMSLPPTPLGVSAGSPGYNSPESERGVKHPASDQFSLAATVYEALSSHLPVDVANRDEYLVALTNWRPVSLRERCPELPSAVSDAVMRALSATPADRFQSCSDFAKALAEAMPTPKQPPPPPPPEPPKPHPSARPASTRSRRFIRGWLVTTSAVAALAIAVLIVRSWSLPTGIAPAAGVVQTPEPVLRSSESIARLLVEADAACELRIDGERKLDLAVGEMRTLEVPFGQKVIDCISRDYPAIRVREIVQAQAGDQSPISLALAVSVKQEMKRREAGETPINGGFLDQGNGTLLDTQTGLEWVQKNHKPDIAWIDEGWRLGARSHCANLGVAGGNWRLPSVEELRSIRDREGQGTVECGRKYCKLSPLLEFYVGQHGGSWFWSGESSGSSRAWVVDVNNGDRHSIEVISHTALALCVRRPPQS